MPRGWGMQSLLRTRRLYFFEKPADPANPTGPTGYASHRWPDTGCLRSEVEIPNIVAQQGTVEDWIIENRSNELHAFHIHQLHFLLLDYLGRPVNDLTSATRWACLITTDDRSSIRPSGCEWIFATPAQPARLCITVIFSNTRTAE